MSDDRIISDIWDSYRYTILHNIITSFGLDFIVQDQYGGDVDTVNSVRENVPYKNASNERDFQNRGFYDRVPYHHNDVYDSTIKAARQSQTFIEDAYVPGNKVYYGKSSALDTDKKANLDHTIPAEKIHNDPGRVLAGLDGVELANQPENLRFTNEHLNKSMGNKAIEEYIDYREKKDPLPQNVQEKMREEYYRAEKIYNKKIEEAYYTSDKFLIDSGTAAISRGVEMGLRQVLGLVFVEIWFSCEDNLKSLPSGVTFSDCIMAVSNGIQNGIKNARNKYKTIISQFEQGFSAGALASLSTTLINIFITTDKNTVKYIRQAYMIVIQVGNIIIINPDDLLVGEQIKYATATLASGVSVLLGTAVGNQIAKTPIGQEEHIGSIVQNFCSSLISCLISCTLLIMIDRSQFINKICIRMNEYGSIEHRIRSTDELFTQLASNMAEYDINKAQKNVELLDSFSKQMKNTGNEEIDKLLEDIFDEFEIDDPWEGDFDTFMGDSSKHLIFE